MFKYGRVGQVTKNYQATTFAASYLIASARVLNRDQGLTDGFIGNKRLVIKAKNLCYIVQIWMLNNKSPLCVIDPVIEVGYSKLDSPVVLVVELHMPMHSNWAHMVRTLY